MSRPSVVPFLTALLCLVQSLSSEYVEDGSRRVLNREKRTVGDCGGTFTDAAGQFGSPSYPNYYPVLQDCLYNITVPSGLYIVLQFRDFGLQATGEDFVEIYDGDQVIEQYRIGSHHYGTDTPAVIQSSGPSLLVRFFADYRTSAQGFLARYTSTTRDHSVRTGTCVDTYNYESGSFTSPLFPSDYATGIDCYYTISLSTGSRIQLEFLWFQTETDIDMVKVYDGTTAEATSLGEFSGTYLPYPVISSGSSLYVHFNSDNTNSARGFYAFYRLASTKTYSVCDDTLVEGVGGTIQSHQSYPSFYERGLECLLMIPTRGLYDKIYLEFNDIDLYSTGSLDCSGGSDVIRWFEAAGTLSTTTCPSSDQLTVTLPDDIISINLVFDSSGFQASAYKGFTATFTLYYRNVAGCHGDDFACNNERCISGALKCDGINHCGDNYDEQDCATIGSSSLDVFPIIGIVAGSFVFLSIVVVICARCCCKKTRTAPSTVTKPAETGMRTVTTTRAGPIDPTKELVSYENTAHTEMQSQPEPIDGGFEGYYAPAYPPPYSLEPDSNAPRPKPVN